MAGRYIGMANLVSVDAIRQKAKFLLDVLLVDLDCWSPGPDIAFSRATEQSQAAPPSPLILMSHGLAGVVLKEVSWIPLF